MSESKKVTLIGSAHPLRGGLAAFNERLIKEFLKRGDDAFIYTFSLQYPSVLFPGKTQYSSEPAPSGIPIHVRVNSVNPVNWVQVGLDLKRQKPDYVIVKYWMPFMAPCLGTICRIIRKNRHSKVISIIDNIIPHEKRPGDRMLSSYWVGAVDGFITMSKSVLTEIESFDKNKPKLFCPHPLYDNFGEPVPKPDAIRNLHLDPSFHYILFFGFIRDYKGLDLLLNAFADESLRKLPLRLLVAGEFYCDPKPYYEIIHRHQLQDRVIMSNDFIPDSQVLNYFCASDLVVQPYKNATQSGVTQIAYHFNKPMIVTDVGGLAEFIPDNRVGYVVKPDSGAISIAIRRFFEENKEAEFSANAAMEKLNYSWERMVDSIDKLAQI